jgi:hypothetical protein
MQDIMALAVKFRIEILDDQLAEIEGEIERNISQLKRRANSLKKAKGLLLAFLKQQEAQRKEWQKRSKKMNKLFPRPLYGGADVFRGSPVITSIPDQPGTKTRAKMN